MAENTSNSTGIRAYFSHSYRPEDKHRNLFFWEMFSDQECYFTVDPKPNNDAPMDITYLEWLMRYSDCFIAVIPNRVGPNSPDGCSPYQSFENALSRRADKPRLVFAENNLPEQLFQGREEETCFFHPTRYRQEKTKFLEKVDRLLEKARAKPVAISRGKRPIAILSEQKIAYTDVLVQAIKSAVWNQCGYVLEKIISPSRDFVDEASFISEIEKYEVIISETRWPYIPLDLFAIPHARCIPTIPICHLSENEAEAQVAKKMNLSYQEENWEIDDVGNVPKLLSKYQLDEGMHPVIFWRNIDHLCKEIGLRLDRIGEAKGRIELWSPYDAKKYFLSIGRRQVEVFISNVRSRNPLGQELAKRLYEEGIARFHYMDFEAIPAGSTNWWDAVRQAIDNSKIFVAIIDKNYLSSNWCKDELKYALERYKKGGLTIHPYLAEDMEWPKELGFMQGKVLTRFLEETWVDLILQSIIDYLESKDGDLDIPTKEDVTTLSGSSDAPAQDQPPVINNYENAVKEGVTAQSGSSNTLTQDQPPVMNNYENAVFVSYSWEGESKRIVDELEQAFAKRGIRVMRDVRDLLYKSSIEGFERRIGQGQCVVLVIGDKYLCSEHCMYELVEVDKNRNLRERIFPILLADAQINKALGRLKYIKLWDEKIDQLDKSIKGLSKMTNVSGIIADLDKSALIRASFDHLTDLLSDMNTLTPEMHAASGFSTLISAVERAINDSHK
jgi:hypothetical protein